MHDEIPLGRIAGFSVKVHWSVLVILWLFTWSLATTLPGAVKGYAPVAYWLAGAGGAAVLLASLLAHELAHAIVARRCGVPVENVTLWLFGGVTTLGGEAKTPKAAFRIAFAGPATSLALSATFGTLAVALAVIRTPPIVVSVAWWLAGSICCWACSICCRAHRWTAAGWSGPISGAVTATSCAPESARRGPDAWWRSS
ncbi:peptidase M50 family protein [Mycobacterium kansasii]|uniref:Peptidase M50 family protein n=1 Tax=Mycobacterium kansasii TaxID=1768 RepID=A0A1V3XWY0_MYCKA|nr:peptidase M50 family protein [Mycobacterium kansasii]